MDIKTANEQREPFEFTCAGEPVKGEFFPYRVTPTYLANLRQLATKAADSSEQPENSDARMISDLVENWDVTNGGEPFPPTPENLREAPLVLLSRAAMGILSHVGKLSIQPESKTSPND